MATQQYINTLQAPMESTIPGVINVGEVQISKEQILTNLLPFEIPVNTTIDTNELALYAPNITNTVSVFTEFYNHTLYLTDPTALRDGNTSIPIAPNRSEIKKITFNYKSIGTSYNIYKRNEDDITDLSADQNRMATERQAEAQLRYYYRQLAMLYFDAKDDIYSQEGFALLSATKLKGFHNAINHREITSGAIATQNGFNNEVKLADIIVDHVRSKSTRGVSINRYNTMLIADEMAYRFEKKLIGASSPNTTAWEYLLQRLNSEGVTRVIRCPQYNDIDTDKHLLVLYDSSKLFTGYNEITGGDRMVNKNGLLLLKSFDLNSRHLAEFNLKGRTRNTFLPDIMFKERGSCSVIKVNWTTS